MATEISKVKRKRTAKRNVLLNSLLPECNELLMKDKDSSVLREADVMSQALAEAKQAVK